MPNEQIPSPESADPDRPSQPPFPPPTASRARARAWVVGSAVAIAAALIAGTLGYVIGTQHSRIGAAVQNFKAAAAGPCRTGQTTPDPSATSPDGTITSVWLIQFGTAADARSYTLTTEQGDAADPANTDKFTVARVTDGMGLARPALDKYGNTLTRSLGDAGNRSIIIHILIPARTDDIAAAHVLLHQNARLSGGSS